MNIYYIYKPYMDLGRLWGDQTPRVGDTNLVF